VHGDGSCAYHSICAGLNLYGYNSLPEEQQKKIEKQIRDDLEFKSKKEDLNKEKSIKELKDQIEKIQKEMMKGGM
jgi:hypothetical protein